MVNESECTSLCVCVVWWRGHTGRYGYVYLPIIEWNIRGDKEETEKQIGR